jgi:hypothetical protein
MFSLLLLSAGIVASTPADLEVIELFRAETPEDLEAALVDGYPMPWLAEILADTTIPEEDRYWLDCRMRAVIAQDLHLFFDRDGNPVSIDAAWIAPGEDYWRECFLVSDSGSTDEGNHPSVTAGVSMTPGIVVNRFGETIGKIPFCHPAVLLSRDGSVGVTPTGGVGRRSRYQDCYACFQYPDSGFVETPIDALDGLDYALSADGSRAVFTCRLAQSSTEDNVIWVLDRNGTVLWTRALPTTPLPASRPAISVDGSLVAVALTPDFSNPEDQGGVLVLDGENGADVSSIPDMMGHRLSFSEDGRTLFISGLSGACAYDVRNDSGLFNWHLQSRGRVASAPFGLRMSSTCNVGCVSLKVYVDAPSAPPELNYIIIDSEGNELVHGSRLIPDISENGAFIVAQQYSMRHPMSFTCSQALPVHVFATHKAEQR